MPLFVVMLVMSATLLLAGCGGEKKDTVGQARSQQPASKDSPKKPEDSVADLFAKGKKIEGMYYDFTLAAKDGNVSGKVWMAGSKVKTEMMAEGRKMITILDGDAAYTYVPEENMAMKIPPDKAKIFGNPMDYSREAGSRPDKVKVLETVTYDGAKCKVVQVAGPEGKEQEKMWIREDCGIPVRVESTGPGGEKAVMEIKNLKVGAQPPETFKLPAGVQVQDLGEMMKQIPQMPQGAQMPQGVQMPKAPGGGRQQ
ncbi:MAG: LolA family protein [Bacillota bacterium]